MKKIAMLSLAALLFTFSCKTSPDDDFFDSSNLPGMIYDSDNRPCDRVTISLYLKSEDDADNLLMVVESDINGRFTLPGLERGAYKIDAEREGYETVSTEIFYSSRLDVLYLKIFSQKQILNLATGSLEEKRYGNVEGFLNRSEKVNGDDPYHLYLKAVFLYEKDRYEEAVQSLVHIVDLGYQFPYVYLLLADIYQYELESPADSLIQLEKYLNLIDDRDVELRMKELKADEI